MRAARRDRAQSREGLEETTAGSPGSAPTTQMRCPPRSTQKAVTANRAPSRPGVAATRNGGRGGNCGNVQR